MKKLFTLIVCAACTVNMMAQSASKAHSFESSLYFSPATLCGGQSYVTNAADGKLKIYDPSADFQCIKEFDIPTFKSYDSYTETGAVTITGAELDKSRSTNPYYYTSSTSIDISNITTSKALADALNAKYGSGYTAVTIPGANYPAAAGSFYMSEIFGNIYPQYGYCIIDGTYYSFDVYYTPTYDESQTTWTRTSTYTPSYGNAINSFKYIDVDAGSQDGNSFYCTKSLFNNDDKWEWVESVYEEPTKQISNVNIGQQVSENSYVISRNVYENATPTSIKIMSEDGAILTINEPGAYFGYIYKMQGDIYLKIEKRNSSGSSYSYTYDLYKYTPGTSSAKKVLADIPVQSQSTAKFVTSDGKIAIRAIDGKLYSTDGVEIK